MLRPLLSWACPRRALHWGNVAPGRNLSLTKSWDGPLRHVVFIDGRPVDERQILDGVKALASTGLRVNALD